MVVLGTRSPRGSDRCEGPSEEGSGATRMTVCASPDSTMRSATTQRTSNTPAANTRPMKRTRINVRATRRRSGGPPEPVRTRSAENRNVRPPLSQAFGPEPCRRLPAEGGRDGPAANRPRAGSRLNEGSVDGDGVLQTYHPARSDLPPATTPTSHGASTAAGARLQSDAPRPCERRTPGLPPPLRRVRLPSCCSTRRSPQPTRMLAPPLGPTPNLLVMLRRRNYRCRSTSGQARSKTCSWIILMGC